MTDSGTEGVTYILPVNTIAPPSAELADYLHLISGIASVEMIVVDGSSPAIFDAHAALLSPRVRHVRPDENLATPMGKVGGVLTGVRLASHERMIIADDDVRYDAGSIQAVSDALASADVVRPQNYFDPLPFHALWDTGRALLNRISGGDWPGTLGVRRSALRKTGGYDGSAMFENLELVRTVVASGGTEAVRSDIYVLRRPSTTGHFWSQRVRQAYDEIARPMRMVVQLAILPTTIAMLFTGNIAIVGIGIIAIIASSEAGRRTHGGARYFPPLASFLAPGWVSERALCIWLALGARVFLGGVPYRGRVLRHAATSMRVLRRRFDQRNQGRPQPNAVPHRSA